MLVKERWSTLSEQLMFEWTLATPTAYNRKKRAHYAFWLTVKDKPKATIGFEATLRICEIEDMQARELKRPTYKRR